MICNKRARKICCKDETQTISTTGSSSPTYLPNAEKLECGFSANAEFIVGTQAVLQTLSTLLNLVIKVGKTQSLESSPGWCCSGGRGAMTESGGIAGEPSSINGLSSLLHIVVKLIRSVVLLIFFIYLFRFDNISTNGCEDFQMSQKII